MEKEIIEELEKILSEKRFKHSIGVMKRAGELAAIYGIDEKEARLAGILHDIAKEMPEEEKVQYCNENNIPIDDTEKIKNSLLHAKIGADIAKKKYHAGKSIQEAILYHTTGSPEMDMLAKIIYIADKTEENRDYEGVEEIRKLSEENINKAMIEIINYTILKSVKEDKVIHPAGIFTRNTLLKEE